MPVFSRCFLFWFYNNKLLYNLRQLERLVVCHPYSDRQGHAVYLKVSKFQQWNRDGLRGESRKHYVHTFRLSTHLEVYWKTLLPHPAGQGVKQFNRSLHQKARQQNAYLMISCSIIPTIQCFFFF